MSKSKELFKKAEKENHASREANTGNLLDRILELNKSYSSMKRSRTELLKEVEGIVNDELKYLGTVNGGELYAIARVSELKSKLKANELEHLVDGSCNGCKSLEAFKMCKACDIFKLKQILEGK